MLLGSQALVNDPYYNDVVLLLRGYDATSGQVFKDYSKYNRTITSNGNVTHSTTQKKYGNSSIYFDGNGDYLSIASSSDFNFGTGDFIIEGWIYPTSVNNGIIIQKDQINGTTFSSFAVYFNNNKLVYYTGNGSSAVSPNIYTTTTSINVNEWTHFSFISNLGVLSMYINGIKDLSGGNGTSIIDAGRNLTIGQLQSGTSLFPLNGYISELRITKKARPNTVPTQPFPNW